MVPRMVTIARVTLDAGLGLNHGVRAHLAARDMSAGGRPATALDRPHKPSAGRGSHGRCWLYATPIHGRGRYPRPPTLHVPRRRAARPWLYSSRASAAGADPP